MANNVVFLSFALCFLISFHVCLSRQQGYQTQKQNVCQIEKLNAQEPRLRIEAEAGSTEYWDWNEQQLQCVGVAACRTIVQPKGLLLPQYTNSPSLVYVLQGRGILGVLMSGCPETFQSSQQSQEQEGERSESQRFRDQHQQIRRFREGDVIALPAGVAHWCHNDGQEDLVLVVIEHTSNNQNQLDNNPRKFMLAGNPQARQQEGQYRTGESRQQEEQHRQNVGNVFRGFTTKFLANVFKVNQETARRLQGHDDTRGHIVRIEGELQVIRPPRSIEQEQQGGGRGSQWTAANGLEETICSSRLVQNINDPSCADVFSPQAGRLTTLDRFSLPILNYLQLSAQRGVLYGNAIKSPNWKQNAHTIVYATRGEAEMQIVNQRGQAVFNERIREGQLVVIPQNFAVVTVASDQGFEWISFLTNDRVIENTLAGSSSTLHAMPVDVLANAYNISYEEAHRLKGNRQENKLFEPNQRSQRSAV